MKKTVSKKKPSNLSGTHLWLVLMKSHRAMQRLATRSIEATQGCLTDFVVLEMLLHKGPQPVNEIGRRIEISSGAITTAVDRLERLGLVTREADPDDRRARIVQLTAAGSAQAAEAFAAHRSAMDSAAKALTEVERATLIELLKKLGVSAAAQANADRANN